MVVSPDSGTSLVIMSSTDSAAVAGTQRKSTGRALLCSAVLPGAGQFYNESYWKVPVIAGFGVYFVAEWISSDKTYRDYRDQYKTSLLTSTSGNSYYLKLRDFYRDQRDSFTWYFLILYVVNLVDAYVDASLFDFNVNSDLSIRTLPAPAGQPLSLTFRLSF